MRIGAVAKLPMVLDLIYEAPLADGAWRPALTAIADFVGSESVDLNFLEPEFLVYRRLEYARIDVDIIQRYSAGFMSDTRNLHPRAHRGPVAGWADVCRQRALEHCRTRVPPLFRRRVLPGRMARRNHRLRLRGWG